MPGRWEHKMEIAVPISYWPHRAGPLAVEGGQLSTKEETVYDVGSFDLFALEEALARRDRWGAKVTVVLVGPGAHEEGLRASLSLGADDAVRLWDEGLESFFPTPSIVTARILAAWIEKRGFQLVLCGDKSSASASGLVGNYLAHFLARPVLSRVVQIETLAETNLKVTCRGEKGSRQMYESPLPAVLSMGRGTEPRYPSLPARLAAQQAEIPVFGLAELQLDRSDIQALASYSHTLRLAGSRPKPKKIFTPDSSLSAADRMKMILAGGVKRKKSNLAEGSQGGAAGVYELLKKEGLV